MRSQFRIILEHHFMNALGKYYPIMELLITSYTQITVTKIKMTRLI